VAATRHLSRAQIMRAIVMMSLILLILRKTVGRRNTMERERKAGAVLMRKETVPARKKAMQLLKNRKAQHLGVVLQMKKVRGKRAMHLKVVFASTGM
jgi:hypothetical protein